MVWLWFGEEGSILLTVKAEAFMTVIKILYDTLFTTLCLNQNWVKSSVTVVKNSFFNHDYESLTAELNVDLIQHNEARLWPFLSVHRYRPHEDENEIESGLTVLEIQLPTGVQANLHELKPVYTYIHTHTHTHTHTHRHPHSFIRLSSKPSWVFLSSCD